MRGSAASTARSSRSTRPPARSWRWPAPRRTTRTRSRRTTRARSGRRTTAGQRPERPAAQPGDQRTLPAGLGLQGGRGGGRAAERADAGHAAGLPDRVHASRDRTRPAQLRQRGVQRAARSRMQTALTNSYNTAFAQARRRRRAVGDPAAAAGFGIGTGDALQTPLRVSPSSLGDIPDTPALAQSVDRAAGRGADPAAGGDDRGRGVEQRRADDAVPGRPGAGAGPDRARHDPAGASCPPRSARRWPAS